MHKNFIKRAEETSVFLKPVALDSETNRQGERSDTNPLRGAKFIDIGRIKPNPNQPRKTFVKETLESLAESIKEVGEIIDPLAVEYDESEDSFIIISGERRYRAAKMVGLERLPCIVKDVDEEKRLLLQLIANLQRENITPLEESAGIKALIERFGYSQLKVATILNKSKSYVSQILGLERLTPDAKKIVQTSELSKEVQIQASREKEPGKQAEILKKASEEGKTVREIRTEGKMTDLCRPERSHDDTSVISPKNNTHSQAKKFQTWTWSPEDGSFMVTLQFINERSENKKNELVEKIER
jgi:ParB family chromosome partitioning protein